MKNSFYKSKEFEPYYQKLGNDTGNRLFKDMKSAFTFAATVGFELNKREPFEKSAGDPLKEVLFQEEMTLFNAIALLTTKDTKILLDENKDERYKIIEEFANGGMHYIVDNIFSGPITTHDKLVDFVKKFDKADDKKDLPFDFSSAVDDVINDLSTN